MNSRLAETIFRDIALSSSITGTALSDFNHALADLRVYGSVTYFPRIISFLQTRICALSLFFFLHTLRKPLRSWTPAV